MEKHVVLAAILAATPLCAQQRASVGEAVPDVQFPQFQNGDGRQRLSDFIGQPVVIDMWGTRCPPCVGTAVPNAIRHDRDLADKGLVTILVESQGSDAQQLERFMWERFPDNGCFSCVGTFVPVPESRGIPYCAVIGVDGRLLWVGNPAATPKRVDELVEEELQKLKKGWGDSGDARKVRAALYGKGSLADAAAAVAATADGDEKLVLQQEVDKRYAVLKAAVDTLKKHGSWLAAEDAAKELQQSVGKHPVWAGEVADLVASFATEEARAELEADKKLDKIEKTMRKGKLDRAPKALQKLIEDAGQTSVGQRAARTLAALEMPFGD